MKTRRSRSSGRARPSGAGPLDAVVAQVDARELQEHWRLFYVAATRAEERLVIAGALGPQAKGEPPAASWYAACARAFDALGVAEGDVREFRGLAPPAPVAAVARATEAEAAHPALPEWIARAGARRKPVRPRPLAPSSLGDDSVADPPPGPAMRVAAERGRLLHALFERLPALAPDMRASGGRALAGRAGRRRRMPRRVRRYPGAALAVIGDPRFSALFAPDALAEAPIAAVVEGLVVSGTVDRLVVGPDSVRVVDFKTGRRAPGSVERDPALSSAADGGLFGGAGGDLSRGARIEAALLYTAGPMLHVLPAGLLDAHKADLVATEQSLASRA